MLDDEIRIQEDLENTAMFNFNELKDLLANEEKKIIRNDRYCIQISKFLRGVSNYLVDVNNLAKYMDKCSEKNREILSFGYGILLALENDCLSCEVEDLKNLKKVVISINKENVEVKAYDIKEMQAKETSLEELTFSKKRLRFLKRYLQTAYEIKRGMHENLEDEE